MKKTIQFIAMATLCLFLSGVAYAQSQALKVGDRVPDVNFENIFNDTGQVLKLSDFKSKLVIVVFWNTTCRTTLESMQQMNALQSEMKDHIQIIAVSDDTHQMLSEAFKKDSKLAATTIPIVVQDTILKELFPNLILPHLAWIYDGQVKAITGIQYLTKTNLRAALDSKGLNWPVKKDVKKFDYRKPLLDNEYAHQNSASPVYYSQLSSYLPGVAPAYGVEVDSLRKTIRTWVVNFPTYKIYLMAFGRFFGLPANQTLWEVKDIGKYLYDEEQGYRDSWNMKNSFCYESILPLDISKEDRMERVRTDLNNFLNLDGRLETRVVDALVLKFDPNEVPVSTGGEYVNTLHRSDTLKVLRKAALSSIAWEMNKYPENPPVVFDKSVNPRIDLDLPVKSMTDIQAISASLQAYGISLTSEKREIEFAVFTEKELEKSKSR